MIRRGPPISPDRIGWALATGSGACGAGAAFLAWGDGAGPGGSLFGGLIGAMLGASVIVAIGAPLWWLVGRRDPLAAGLIGAGGAALPTIAVLTGGFGLALPPGADAGAVWTSALAMGAVAGFLGGLIALAMWLVAYPDR